MISGSTALKRIVLACNMLPTLLLFCVRAADANDNGSIWVAEDDAGGFSPGSMIAQSGYTAPEAYVFRRDKVKIVKAT